MSSWPLRYTSQKAILMLLVHSSYALYITFRGQGTVCVMSYSINICSWFRVVSKMTFLLQVLSPCMARGESLLITGKNVLKHLELFLCQEGQ